MKKYFAMAYIIISVLFFVVIKIPTTHSLPQSYMIEGFKYTKQPDDISCGPTSLFMVLERQGKHHSLEEIKKQTKTTWISYGKSNIGMTSPDYMASALKKFGIPSHLMHGEMNDLKYYVSQNRSPIVLLRSGKKTWHYAVVIGYDKSTIFLADPNYGAINRVPVDVFLGSWNFTKDLYGSNIVTKCFFCGGTGRIGEFQLGPLNICDHCNGTGNNPDYILFAVKASDVSPKTMIVPALPLVDGKSNSTNVP